MRVANPKLHATDRALVTPSIALTSQRFVDNEADLPVAELDLHVASPARIRRGPVERGARSSIRLPTDSHVGSHPWLAGVLVAFLSLFAGAEVVTICLKPTSETQMLQFLALLSIASADPIPLNPTGPGDAPPSTYVPSECTYPQEYGSIRMTFKTEVTNNDWLGRLKEHYEAKSPDGQMMTVGADSGFVGQCDSQCSCTGELSDVGLDLHPDAPRPTTTTVTFELTDPGVPATHAALYHSIDGAVSALVHLDSWFATVTAWGEPFFVQCQGNGRCEGPGITLQLPPLE